MGMELWRKDVPAGRTAEDKRWRAEEFCGVQILTYAILSNHWHILVQVPDKLAVSNSF
jgi:REP element-mobilizing transposase RayT